VKPLFLAILCVFAISCHGGDTNVHKVRLPVEREYRDTRFTVLTFLSGVSYLYSRDSGENLVQLQSGLRVPKEIENIL
jgi:hypothetical protein